MAAVPNTMPYRTTDRRPMTADEIEREVTAWRVYAAEHFAFVGQRVIDLAAEELRRELERVALTRS